MTQYNALVQQYFYQDTHNKRFAASDDGVVTVKQGNSQIGDSLELQVKCVGETIEAMRFKAFGNPYCIAICAWLCEQYSGKTRQQLQQCDAGYLIDLFEIPTIKHYVAYQIEQLIQQLLIEVNHD